MTNPLMLGIDIGTSSTKAMLVATDGTVAAEARAAYQFDSSAPGHAELDPDIWVDAAGKAIGALASRADLSRIAAIGVAGQMRGVTFLGAGRRPVRKSMLWNDTRCTREVADAVATAGPMLERLTINPLNTMASLPKYLWVMRNEPEIWADTETLVFPKDYLVLALTGTVQTDFSDASGSSVFDVRAKTWSAEILDAFGIDRAKFPEIRQGSDIAAPLTAEAAARFGLPAGIPVVTGGSDSTLDSFAAGLAPGEVKIRLGTSGAISWLVDSPDAIGSKHVYCWNYVTPGLYLADINTRSCAQSVDWLTRIAYRDCASAEAAYAALSGEAAGIAPGAEGVVFRPHLQGEDAPFWDPDMTGSFTGLTAAHTRAHLARAVLEGTAFALADALSITGLVMPSHARLVGGGTKNRVWTGILRDLLGCRTLSNPDRDTAYGAARLAAQGAGIALAAEATDGAAEAPDPARHALYQDLLAVYRKRLVPANAREIYT